MESVVLIDILCDKGLLKLIIMNDLVLPLPVASSIGCFFSFTSSSLLDLDGSVLSFPEMHKNDIF